MVREKLFKFLVVEFIEVYNYLEMLYQNKETDLIEEIEKLLNYIVELIYKKNKLYQDKKIFIINSLYVLRDIKVVPDYILDIFEKIVEELGVYQRKIFLDENINEKSLREEVVHKLEKYLYEISVWTVVNIGEENYLLLLDNLDIESKSLFEKAYNWNKEEVKEEKNKELTQLEIDTLVEKGESYYFGKGVKVNKSESLKYFLEAAKYGNEIAKAYLGMFYEKGITVKKDYKMAIKWYTKAANKGVPFAQYSLGMIYLIGEEIKKDYNKALIYFSKSAENEYVPSYYQIGRCYYNGFGVEVDYAIAFKWYMKGAEQNSGMAQYALALMYKKGEACEKNLIKAYYWLEKAAENNCENAYYIIGKSYLEGICFEVDYERAYKYLKKGYEEFDTDCIEALGDMYLKGLHVEKDILKAVEVYNTGIDCDDFRLYYKIAKVYEDEELVQEAITYYEKGSMYGDDKCTQRLGVIYYNGEGVERDIERAIYYMEKASENKAPHAMYMLGVAYIRLNKLGKDTYKEAQRLLEEAYTLKSPYAAEYLAYLMLVDKREGKVVDEEKLLEYIEFGVENELKDSIFQYGYIYEHGIAVEKDLERAHDYYRIAAEQDCIKAMLTLAEGYKKGEYLSRNIELSIKWYEKAAEHNEIDAIENLIEIYEKGIGGYKSDIKALFYVFKLIDLDGLKGKAKLVYYCLKGAGIEVNIEKANEMIQEIEDIDKGTANNLRCLLAREGLIELNKEEIVELYLEGINLGNCESYGELAEYLYENNMYIDEEGKESFDIALSGRELGNLKSLYIYFKMYLEGKFKVEDIDEEELLIIDNLNKLINKGIYSTINYLISWHEKKGKDNSDRYYKLKEEAIFYNVI